jgi:hypothetical protein
VCIYPIYYLRHQRASDFGAYTGGLVGLAFVCRDLLLHDLALNKDIAVCSRWRRISLCQGPDKDEPSTEEGLTWPKIITRFFCGRRRVFWTGGWSTSERLLLHTVQANRDRGGNWTQISSVQRIGAIGGNSLPAFGVERDIAFTFPFVDSFS